MSMYRLLIGAVFSIASVFVSLSAVAADGKQKAIVLVHGGFVDGSGWESVYQILTGQGYDVSIVQNRQYR